VNALDWIIIASGLAAIVWVNWYFLLAAPKSVPDRPASP
jgi:hypothetical protein